MHAHRRKNICKDQTGIMIGDMECPARVPHAEMAFFFLFVFMALDTIDEVFYIREMNEADAAEDEEAHRLIEAMPAESAILLAQMDLELGCLQEDHPPAVGTMV